MADDARGGPEARRIGWTVLAALVFISATLIGVVAEPVVGLPPASPSAAPPRQPPGGDPHPARDQRQQGPLRPRTAAASPRPPARGRADRANRGGLTVFDHDSPAVAKLDPALRTALRHAAADAAGDGVELLITSGWRSAEHQARLLRQAISTYGSRENAARWVASADTSAHVSGDAVDVGPSRAAAWLARHGAAYRLCQIYRNEPWHYELRPDAVDAGCPPMYADPTHDPRMQP